MASPAAPTAAPAGRLDVSAWLLLEKKSTFCAAKWRAARASFSRARLFPPPTRPQVLLALEFHEENAPSAELVVVRPHASPAGDRDAADGRARLPLEVRTMEDVRTAQRFLTSAPSQMLDLFVDAHDAGRVLAFLSDPNALVTSTSAALAVTASASPSELIDGAFAALERAQQERERGKQARALALFREAERGFSAAERLLPDERSRGLIRSRRQDLERSIVAIEAQIRSEEAGGPSAVAGSATMATSSVVATETPKPPPPPPPSVDILARLEELRRFVATSDTSVATTSSSKSRDDAHAPNVAPAAAPAPVASELTTRLAALRNGGKAPAGVDVGELAERLRRLRGADSERKAAVASAWVKDEDEEESDEEEQVKRVIQRATEELALGIVDDLDADEEDLSVSSSSSSSRSGGSDASGRKQ